MIIVGIMYYHDIINNIIICIINACLYHIINGYNTFYIKVNYAISMQYY